MAQEQVKEKGLSIRLACRIFGISEHCYRYLSKRNDDNIHMADWLMRLTDHHRHWGCGLCFLY
jgi:putative transposase